MKTTNVKKLTITALLISLTYVATAFIKIPIPFGYVNLGFCFLLISVFFFGTKIGIMAGSIGSALADFLSPYAIWTIPTFLIKVAIAFAVGYILFYKSNTKKLYGVKTIVAVITGSLIHVIGYTGATAVIGGSFYAALVTAPLLGLECIVNMIAFFALASFMQKTRVKDLIQY